MKNLLTLCDADLFPEIERISNFDDYVWRRAVKVIIFDKYNKVALVGGKHIMLLPGGGMEEGESIVEAAKRECLEEVGCDIEVIKEIGFTEDYRYKIKRHQTTYFLVAKVAKEKGLPQSTQEDEIGIQIDWYDFDEAIDLLEKQKEEISSENYHHLFNVRTNLVALIELKSLGE